MRRILLALIALVYAAIGNAQVSSYTFSQSTGTYTPIAGTVVHGSGWDDAVSSVTIPFSFTYNGTAYTSVNVSINGFVTFGATAPGATNYTPVSSTEGYNAAISAFGRDLISNSTTIVTVCLKLWTLPA